MRLERLTLAPYGRFADRTLSFRPGASLHVVLGANEPALHGVHRHIAAACGIPLAMTE